jgi:hypothetical protein
MNVDTGELFRLSPEEKRIMLGNMGGENQTGILQKMRELEREKAELVKAMGDSIKVVPEEFSEEANRLLGEQDRIFVDMEKDTPLVNWAKSQHKPDNSKKKRKMAKQSRKQNRK